MVTSIATKITIAIITIISIISIIDVLILVITSFVIIIIVIIIIITLIVIVIIVIVIIIINTKRVQKRIRPINKSNENITNRLPTGLDVVQNDSEPRPHSIQLIASFQYTYCPSPCWRPSPRHNLATFANAREFE